MVFAKTRGLYKYMHSQWTRIHCSDGRWRETPKALYYNHLPAAYLTFASPSVFVFLFVLKPAFEFLIILFEFVILLQPSLQLNILYLHLFLFFFCIWFILLFVFEVVLQSFVQLVSHLHPIWFDFFIQFQLFACGGISWTIQITSQWQFQRNCFIRGRKEGSRWKERWGTM